MGDVTGYLNSWGAVAGQLGDGSKTDSEPGEFTFKNWN